MALWFYLCFGCLLPFSLTAGLQLAPNCRVPQPGLNPGNYQPLYMSKQLCSQLCSKVVNYGFTYYGLYQSKVCLCQLSEGEKALNESCNATCAGNIGEYCGDSAGLYATVLPTACDLRVLGVYASLNPLASTPTSISTSLVCYNNASSNISVNATYDHRYQSDSVLFRIGVDGNVLNLPLVYFYRAPGVAVTKLSFNYSTVQVVSLPIVVDATVGMISSVSSMNVLLGEAANILVTVAVTTASTMEVAIASGSSSIFSIPGSAFGTFGSTSGAVKGSVDTGFVWLMPSLVANSKVTLMDIRFVLNGSLPTVSTQFYLQIYRPNCPAGYKYSYLQNNCVLNGTSNTLISNVRVQKCASLNYSLSSRSCFDGVVLPNKIGTLNFTSYYLQYEAALDLSAVVILNVAANEYLINLASQTAAISMLPGDVPAVYQPDTSNCAIALGAASNLLKLPIGSIGSWNHRSTLLGRVSSYPFIAFNATDVLFATTNPDAAVGPLISFSYGRPVDVNVSFTYNNHSCKNVTSCYKVDSQKVTFTVRNSNSSNNATTSVEVFLPIAALNLTLPSTCLTYNPCNLTINPHYGSRPQYVIDFDDGSPTLNLTYIDSLILQHTYMSGRQYTITVTAFNVLSSSTVQQSVLVVDAIQAAQIYPAAYPVGAIGQPLKFVVTAAQGSNTTLSVDFGDGTGTSVIGIFNYAAFTYKQFFIPLLGANLLSPAAVIDVGTGGAEACSKLCLQSTNDTFYCHSFSLIGTSTTCSLFNQPIYLLPSFSIDWSASSSVLYVLQNNSCSSNLLQSLSYVVKATSGSTSAVSLNQTGWTSVNGSGIQAISFEFPCLVVVNVILISTSTIQNVSIQISNDSKTYVSYISNIGSSFKLNLSSTTSTPVVLDPPIIARVIKILVLKTSENDLPSAQFGFSGCPLQAFKNEINHTYNPASFNTTSLVNVSLAAQNTISQQSVFLPFLLDVPIGNLTLRCLSNDAFFPVNGTIPFRVSGTWGNYIKLTINRHDGVTLASGIFSFQTFYDFNLTFTDSGLWFLSVTASNYVGTTTYYLTDYVRVMVVVNPSCSAPYVDLTIPNACVVGKTCDSSVPKKYNPMMVYRSSSFIVYSNTTNFCSRTALFKWSVQKCNAATGQCTDYSTAIANVYATRYNSLARVVLNGTQLYSLSFHPRVFEYGLYNFTLFFTIPGGVDSVGHIVADLYGSSSTFFSIVRSPLVACVNDFSSYIAAPWDTLSNTTLNASCSSDPDVWPDEPNDLFYYWSCYRECETAPNYDDDLNFKAWGAGNPYSTQCPTIYPKMSNITASSNGCFLPFDIHKSGPITPRIQSDWSKGNPNNPLGDVNNPGGNKFFIDSAYWLYTMPSDNTSITVNSVGMFFDAKLFFLLNVGKTTDKRRAQTMLVLLLNAKLAPALKFSCIANCNPTNAPTMLFGQVLVDPLTSFKVDSSILNYNPLAKYTFGWSICKTGGTRTKALTFNDVTSLLTNISDYKIDYAWSHASTSSVSPGVSFDSDFPLFDSSFHDKILALVVNVTVDDGTGPRSGLSSLMFIVCGPPNASNIDVAVYPSTGSALTTKFTIYCSGGYSDNLPLSYSIGYTTYADTNTNDANVMQSYALTCVWLAIRQRVCAPPGPVTLPSGNITMNNTLFICIGVTDSIGSTSYAFRAGVTVLPVPLTDNLLATKADSTYLQTMADTDPNAYIAIANAILQTINAPKYASATTNTACNSSASCPTTAPTLTTTGAYTSSSTAAQKQIAVKNILSTMGNMPSALNTYYLKQYADLTMVATQNPDWLTENSNVVALKNVNSWTSQLQTLTSASSTVTSAKQTEAIGSSIYSTITNVLQSNFDIQLNHNSTDQSTAKSTAATPISFSKLIDDASYNLSLSLLKTKVAGEKLTNLNNHFGVQMRSTTNLASITFALNGTSCTKFSTGSSIDCLFSKTVQQTPAAVQLVLSSTTPNQYTWLPNSLNMKQTQSISFLNNGIYYNVTNATGERNFEIWLDTQLDPTTVSGLNVNTTPYTLPYDSFMLTHKVFVKGWSNLFINIQHYLNWTLIPYNVTINGSVEVRYYTVLQNSNSYNGSNVMFVVYVEKNRKPTDSSHSSKCILPNFDVQYLSCASQALNMTAVDNATLFEALAKQTNLNYYENLIRTENRCSRFSQTQMNPWTCMFPTSELNNTEDSTYYVGVRAVVWNWTLPVINGTFNPNSTSETSPSVLMNNPKSWTYLQLNYTFFAYYAGCYFYDDSTRNYSSRGCTVGKCSSPYATQCFCSHLTSFSNLFRLPQISFDITSLNINALNSSPGVMCFLVAVICAYFIVWIWARNADLTAEEKLGVVYLPDNDSRDEYAYEITIWTGNLPGSGTTANVSLILAGDSGETEPRWLCNSVLNYDTFKTGSIDMFLLTTPDWLGTLSHMRVWHDNTGAHPSWYLLRVLIRDIYTDTKYYFIVNNWFSAEKDEGIVDRLLPVAGKQELRGYKNILWTRAPNKIFDGHMWLSVVTRPTRSRFTRVQRLTCCLVMCLTSVLFNLLGYIVRFNANQNALTATSNPDPPILVIGPIAITAYTLTISLISAACTIPINLIIVLLFQQRRIREPTKTLGSPYARFKFQSKDNDKDATAVTKKDEKEEDDDEDLDSCDYCLEAVSRCATACMAKILPFAWWSHYVAYALAFLTVVAAFLCSAILAYSNLPQAWQQNDWLMSIILTLLQSIFIIQPLQIFLILTIFTLIVRLPEEDLNEMSKELSVRRTLVEIPETIENGPRKSVPVKPPPYTTITQTIREKSLKESQMQSEIIGFTYYLAYLILLFIMLYTFVSPWRYYQSESNMMHLHQSYPYQEQKIVPNINAAWSLIRKKILPAIYSKNLSNLPEQSFYQPLLPMNYTSDGSSLLIGARLRQLRVASGGCAVPDLLSAIVPSCYGEYSVYSTDTQDYLQNWKPVPKGFFSNRSSPFTYLGYSSDLGAAVQGVFSSANGGGYVANLSSTLQDSLEKVANLTASNWLDSRTRIVFIEYLTFNPSTYLYTIACNRILMRPTGFELMPMIYSLQLNRYEGVTGSTCLLSQILALLFLIVFIIKTFVALSSSAKRFWKDGWEVYDLIVSIISLIAVLVYGIQIGCSLNAMQVIQNAPNQFKNLGGLCQLDAISTFMIGLLVFMMDLRLLKYLHGYKRTRILLETFSGAIGPLLALVFQFLVILLAFISGIYLILFSYCSQFSEYTKAFVNILASLIYASDFKLLCSLRQDLGIALFSFYAISVVLILMRGFAPILAWSLRVTRSKYNAVDQDSSDDPLNYILWKCKMFCGFSEAENHNLRYEYQAGIMDYDLLYQNVELKFTDLTHKVKSSLSPEDLKKVEQKENATDSDSCTKLMKKKILLS